jgi:hypothetical protein
MTEPPTLRRLVVCIIRLLVIFKYNICYGNRYSNAKNNLRATRAKRVRGQKSKGLQESSR